MISLLILASNAAKKTTRFLSCLEKYIENVYYSSEIYYKVKDDDNEYIIIYVVFSFDVDDDNPYIYSLDGKLYNKETNELIFMNYTKYNNID